MKKHRLAIAQISSKFANIRFNVEKHVQTALQAKKDGADIALFPELGLSGYSLRDLALQLALKPDSSELESILKASKEIAIVCSFPELCPDHVVRISAALFDKGEIVHIYRKVHPPTHGMFEELRYFGRGDRIRAFDTRFGRMGLMICRDFWHPEQAFVLARDGAEIILGCSAIPARSLNIKGFAVSGSFESTVRTIATSCQIYAASSNKVGFEDGVAFMGASVAFSPTGRQIARLPEIDEKVEIVDVCLDEVGNARFKGSLYREQQPDLIELELERIRKNARN